MAFLCPVRIRRDKRKKEGSEKGLSSTPSIGRITGSASIETLVRVGLEKEAGLSPDSKMVVLHDFTPCVDDELEVRRGQHLNLLYQENDWVYVIAEDGREGFIPHSYCAPYGSHFADLALTIKHKKLPRPEEVDASVDSGQGGEMPGDVHPFLKDPAGGRFVVLYTFVARDENDVSVERGEVVTVLNREDHDWFWIVRSDGQEGFVPSAFVYPADVIRDHTGGNPSHHASAAPHGGGGALPADEARFHGSELVMLYDYKAQAPDDLSVRRGDWVYADLDNQTVDGWLWAYAPKTRKYGFIPKAYARPPAMTSL